MVFVSWPVSQQFPLKTRISSLFEKTIIHIFQLFKSLFFAASLKGEKYLDQSLWKQRYKRRDWPVKWMII